MQTKILFLVTFLIIGLVVAQDITKIITYTFGGGSPQCSTCGGKAGEFACSNDIGDWHGGKRDFLDPLSYEDFRNGYKLTKLMLSFSGTYDCYGKPEGAIIGTTINDEPIEVKAKTGSFKCECGRCDGSLVFTNNFNIGGFPGFHYGTYNTLSISTFNNAICLKDATLNLTYSKPVSNSTTFFVDFNTDNNSCTACFGIPGRFQCANTGAKLTKSFRDPLPDNTVPIGITLQWYFKTGGSASYMGVTTYVNSQFIDSLNVNNMRLNQQPYCNDCQGRTVSTSPLYLAGFPDYNKGDMNTISFTVGGSFSVLCISRVQIVIQYHRRS